MTLAFRILGPLEVTADDRPLALGALKQRSLLAVLLLSANDVVSVERLVDEVWGESPPATVGKSVQVYVSRLRKQLGDGRLVTQAPGYLLRVDESELDVARFERLVAEGRAGEALALWRGPPLADLAYEPFAQPHIRRLEELRMLALEQRIAADLSNGRHSELVGELDALVAANPLREGLRAQRMLALYRCGRQAEALEAYRDARDALTGELGIEPGRDLRELHQRILRQDERLDLPPPTPATRPQQSVFVGRERELEELVGALDDAFAGRGRLLLIEGEPGIGKSRLAEELTAQARARGARVLVGRCWEAGGAPVYWPWVQALRAYLREPDGDALRAHLGAGAAHIAQIVPELRGQLSDLPEPRALDSDAARFRRLQRYGLCEFLGRVEDVLPELHDSVAEYPTRPVFRCALAHAHARLGHTAEAERRFEELALDEFSVLPFDQEWLLGMSLLAETSAVLGDADSAAVLYRLLVPWERLNVGDHPEGIRGSVARYLGILATATGRWDQAEVHFDAAAAANERMGLRPFLALARLDHARMLIARDLDGDRARADELRREALTAFRALGIEPPREQPALHA